MNNTLTFTKPGKEDAEALRALAITTFRQSHGNSAPAEDIDAYIDAKFTAEQVASELADASNVFYFVYVNEELAGYSKISYNTAYENLTPPNSTKLERLYVLEKFHDQKIGKQLMEFNLDLAQQNDQAAIWLYVWTENHRAVRFYKNYGFQPIAETLFHISARHANPNWILSLKI